MNVQHTNGLPKPAWAPAPYRLAAPTKALGQQGFFESPTLNFVLDTWTALAAAYLGWGFSSKNNRWGTFWYVVAAASSIKALYDLSKMERSPR